MRKEPYTTGSYVHVINRGSRGMPIVRDNHDQHRFLLMLRHFNDQFYPENWFKDLLDQRLLFSFERPDTWPPQEKLVEILCFCLLGNHFHLLLKELVPQGIPQFMKRLGTGMSRYFNEKYKERGSLFQGSYRLRTIEEDTYLQYASAYIQIKNCFEMHPKGFSFACKNFDESFSWAASYPYCSLGEMLGARERSITNPEVLSEIFTRKEYQEFCRDFIGGKIEENIAQNLKYMSDM